MPPERRIPLFVAAVLVVILGTAVAGGALYLGWSVLLQGAPVRSQSTLLLDILKVSLALTGGIGAAVALVVAFRRQSVAESDHQLRLVESDIEVDKAYQSRLESGVRLLGDKDSQTTRLAGAYSLLTLGDEWESGRQTCIDVLCGYLRLAPPGEDGRILDKEDQLRSEVARSLFSRFSASRSTRWENIELNLSNCALPDIELRGLAIIGGRLDISSSRSEGLGFSISQSFFKEVEINLSAATPSNPANVSIDRSHLVECSVKATGLAISDGGRIAFTDCTVESGQLDFSNLKVDGGQLDFSKSRIVRTSHRPSSFGSLINFSNSIISSGSITLDRISVSAASQPSEQELKGMRNRRDQRGSPMVDFGGTRITGTGAITLNQGDLDWGDISFRSIHMDGGEIDLANCEVLNSQVDFTTATLNGGTISFAGAHIWTTHTDNNGAPIDWFQQLAMNNEAGSSWYPGAEIPYASVTFHDATLNGTTVSFAQIDCDGGGGGGSERPNGRIELIGMHFKSGLVDFQWAFFGACTVDIWRPYLYPDGASITLIEQHYRPRLIVSARKSIIDNGLFVINAGNLTNGETKKTDINVFDWAADVIEMSDQD